MLRFMLMLGSQKKTKHTGVSENPECSVCSGKGLKNDVFYILDVRLGLGIDRLKAADVLDGMDDGGVVAASEFESDLHDALVGVFVGEVDGQLSDVGDGLLA